MKTSKAIEKYSILDLFGFLSLLMALLLIAFETVALAALFLLACGVVFMSTSIHRSVGSPFRHKTVRVITEPQSDTMTASQRRILQHAMGRAPDGTGYGSTKESYRDHYVVGEMSDTFEDCLILFDRGYLSHERTINHSDPEKRMFVFNVTDKAKTLLSYE